MPNPDLYVGREQTYVKHFVLERYLERVAYNIYSFSDDFVYVDGFSGPWKSQHEEYEDTSFKIALDKLRQVRQGIEDRRNRSVSFRCLFIEKDDQSYNELREAVDRISDVDIETKHGRFEDHISEICDFAKQSFSLVFIDPTGWQGFPMTKIRPVLQLRGEVLINFMSDFITRFIGDPRPHIARSFDDTYGGEWYSEWEELRGEGLSIEAAAVEVYANRLKKFGDFGYVTWTRILKPKADRSYFYLIYATRHWKGIQEFRGVEKKAVDQQEKVRGAAKYRAQLSKTGQTDLFGEGLMNATTYSYEAERDTQLSRARSILDAQIEANQTGIKYEHLMATVLETPLVWKDDLDGWLSELRNQSRITIVGMTQRQHVPKKGDVIMLTDGSETT